MLNVKQISDTTILLMLKKLEKQTDYLIYCVILHVYLNTVTPDLSTSD